MGTQDTMDTTGKELAQSSLLKYSAQGQSLLSCHVTMLTTLLHAILMMTLQEFDVMTVS